MLQAHTQAGVGVVHNEFYGWKMDPKLQNVNFTMSEVENQLHWGTPTPLCIRACVITKLLWRVSIKLDMHTRRLEGFYNSVIVLHY